MVKINPRNVNKKKCKTCIFNDNADIVDEKRLTEIKRYLLKGTNHICHTTNKVCRGGREFQLQCFNRMGLIKKPTDKSLYKKMESMTNRKNS